MIRSHIRHHAARVHHRYIEPRKFITLIVLVVATAYVLVAISMHLYNTSGAAQLDMSRPGYQAVREQTVDKDADINQDFSSTGKLDKAALSEFRDKFKSRAQKVIGSKSFANDVLSDEELGIFADNNGSATE